MLPILTGSARAPLTGHIAIGAVLALLLMALWAHTLGLIADDHAQAIASAESELLNLGRASQEHAERTFQSIDQTLRLMQWQLNEHAGHIDLQEMDRRSLIDHDILIQVSVVDAQGVLKMSSLPFDKPPNIFDRPNFQAQLSATLDELQISRPELGRHSGQWSIFLTRRLTNSNGQFDGIVVASLNPGYFANFYNELRLGSQPVATLFGLDGQIRVRRTERGNTFRGDVSASPFFQAFAEGRKTATLTTRSVTDGVERMVHYRKLDTLPLVVAIGFDTTDVFAEQQQKEAELLRHSSLVTLLMLSFGALSSWYLRTRQRQVAALLAAHKRLLDITEQAPGALFQFLRQEDGRYRFTFASAGIRDLFELAPDAGPDLARMYRSIHASDIDELKASVEASAQGLSLWRHNFRIVSGDGTVRSLSGMARPQRQADNSILWNGYLNDTSHRRRAEDALRDSETRERQRAEELAKLLDVTPAAIFVAHDEQATLITGNRQAYDWMGLPVGENLSLVAPDAAARKTIKFTQDGEELQAAQLPLLQAASGTPIYNFGCELISLDGSRRHTLANSIPLLDRSGRPRGAIAAYIDITALHEAKQALVEARNDADRANNAKSRFLAAASHDLRQPLSALSLYVSLLKGKARAADRAMVASMGDCIANLNELLCDLLDLSKLQAEVVKPCPANFSLAGMFDELASIHALEARSKGLRLRCVPTYLAAHTDPVLYRRILGNFIANAIRYTKHGSILVACRRAQGKIWVEVRDSGIGIAPEQTREIFEEFTQLGNDARTRGSGLGLAIVARTAALLGLEIRVNSRLGRGSMFAIELPLGEQLLEPPPKPMVLDLPCLRIALVEDNAMVRDALVVSLQNIGQQVIAAASLAELLAEIDQTPVDGVISDYRLGQGETGLEVIAALRARFGRELPAILITGDTDPMLLRQMNDQSIDVLHKPLDLATLRARLEAWPRAQ